MRTSAAISIQIDTFETANGSIYLGDNKTNIDRVLDVNTIPLGPHF